jgi:hypothetical protein
MYALKDSTTAHSPTSKLVATWARGRRQITPWAFPRLLFLAVTRLTIGIFLVGVGAVLVARGHDGWGAVPFAGAALLLAIGSLDMAVVRSAAPRT